MIHFLIRLILLTVLSILYFLFSEFRRGWVQDDTPGKVMGSVSAWRFDITSREIAMIAFTSDQTKWDLFSLGHIGV